MQTIKVTSTKKGIKVVKLKTLANEHYVITDESGKVFKKLKFVQVDKNLEVYAEIDGKEEKVVVLENYYDPNTNASVVGMDSNNHEIGYVYNEKDGWYYLLSDTELGVVAFPFLGVGAGII